MRRFSSKKFSLLPWSLDPCTRHHENLLSTRLESASVSEWKRDRDQDHRNLSPPSLTISSNADHIISRRRKMYVSLSALCRWSQPQGNWCERCSRVSVQVPSSSSWPALIGVDGKPGPGMAETHSRPFFLRRGGRIDHHGSGFRIFVFPSHGLSIWL